MKTLANHCIITRHLGLLLKSMEKPPTDSNSIGWSPERIFSLGMQTIIFGLDPSLIYLLDFKQPVNKLYYSNSKQGSLCKV